MASPCVLYSDYDLLREVATRTGDACRAVGDAQGAAAMSSALACVETDLGEWAAGQALYAAAYELFADVGDLYGQAFSATFAADSARMGFEYENGRDLSEVTLWSTRATMLCEKLDDPFREADLAYVLGKLFLATDEVDRARERFASFLRLASALDKPVSQAHALYRLGNVAHKMGRRSDAAASYSRAIEISQDVGDRPGVGYIALSLAAVLAESGNHREAMNQARRALSIFRELGMKRKAAETHVLLKRLALH
jgi:tetratricopeptide (TPR) repeat protein